MGLFRSKKKTVSIDEKDHIVASNSDVAVSDGVKTSLVFHEHFQINNQDKYVYQFHHQKLPELKPWANLYFWSEA
ncbi:hypothetical protein [Cytobacillus purgationiresistens]|uniref:Uncharacterized protein n=1 Tax=Cytobacillus purgationiresistens TaxID=863449 RepID=A0ABU0ACZ5_9BACI|nr:hypothetical protein [Cytobacillus purgationiresistens]MDQ0269126.1 hypothetical protein [Cytobacillus purgationiresistens]